MKIEHAIGMTSLAVNEAIPLVSKCLECGVRRNEKVNLLVAARDEIQNARRQFLESDSLHQHSDLFGPLTKALQEIRGGLQWSDKSHKQIQDAKRTLDELQRLCNTLGKFVAQDVGGEA